MKRNSFKVFDKASLSLTSVLRRQSKKMHAMFAASSAGFTSVTPEVVRNADRVSILVQTTDAKKVSDELGELSQEERTQRLSKSFVSAHVTLRNAKKILKHDSVQRVQTKKKYQLHLDQSSVNIGLRTSLSGSRAVSETGQGVLIGIVDSGFDLSHPMFRDGNGRLRVDGLLDQTGNSVTEFNSAQLEAGWDNGTNPGADSDGHGSHVATTAGGTKFKGFEGVAPQARFLLVKTNFRDTADGVQWIFSKAGTKPCVANLSLGTHWGPHDGSTAEELLIDQLSGAGKVVVISAGNERARRLHIGGRFLANETQTVTFDVPPSNNLADPPQGALTLWYDPSDAFSITLITPSGQELAVPAIGSVDSFTSSSLDIEIGRQDYTPTNLIQVQIILSFRSALVSSTLLNNWGLRIRCDSAVIGRIDGWFANNGFGRFDPHPLVEETRTIGMPATAASCLAVASHVSKDSWLSDDGSQQDLGVLVGRSSPFSSQGPTRNGQSKPDISAPGQYITAALASGSQSEDWGERARSSDRLLTIEGTSMAAPIVTGIVALMLQKKKTLKPDQIRTILAESATIDGHVGVEGWNPAYGHGKVDVKKTIANT